MSQRHVHEEANFDFGTRLTQAEYEQRVIALHTAVRVYNQEAEAAVRQADLNLLIDYSLGVKFPLDRRQALWKVQQQLDQQHGWNLLKGVLAHPRDPSAALARAQVRAFSKLLDRNELRALLDLAEADLIKLL